MTQDLTIDASAASAPGGELPFRFGVALPTSGPLSEPGTIFRFATVAEAAGFDDVWVNDHLIFDPSQRGTTPVGTVEAVTDQDPVFYESITTAAAVLGRLQRIGVGIGGLALPMRDPRWLAKQASSLHELTGRRLTLGPGMGMIERSYQILQVPFERRGRLFDEYLAVLHAICHDERPVAFEGDTIQFEDANLYPRPAGLRVLVAGEGERVLGRAAKWGDGWLTSWPDLTEYARKVRLFRRLVEEHGRDPNTMDTAAIVWTSIGPSVDRALETTTPSFLARFETVEDAKARSVIGTPAMAIDRLAAMHEAGMRYVHLRPMIGDPGAWVDMVQTIARDVLPAVRGMTQRSAV